MKRNYRELRQPGKPGRAEYLGAPITSHCRSCRTRIMWGQQTPRRWVMIDDSGAVHKCRNKRVIHALSNKAKTVKIAQ